MITIRPITTAEIPAARRVILQMAYDIYGWEGGLEASIRYWEASGEFDDMANVEEQYFQNCGLFLVVLDDKKVIGSGAVKKFNASTAELKRLWLLEEYHGQGIGYRVVSQLIDFSQTNNYKRIILQTSPEQTRAITFYKKLGFQEIESYNQKAGEISLELQL